MVVEARIFQLLTEYTHFRVLSRNLWSLAYLHVFLAKVIVRYIQERTDEGYIHGM
jgi:hypothetical protein